VTTSSKKDYCQTFVVFQRILYSSRTGQGSSALFTPHDKVGDRSTVKKTDRGDLCTITHGDDMMNPSQLADVSNKHRL